MGWWRHSRTVRAVVVALLLWTGADLTNPALCALDRERQAPAAATDDGSATLASLPGQPAPDAPAAPHVDDCFCCSHCVEIQPWRPVLDTEPPSRDYTALIVAAPRLFGLRLYRPPLA